MYLLNEFVSVIELGFVTSGATGLAAGSLAGRKASKEGKNRVRALTKGTTSGALAGASGLSVLGGIVGNAATKGQGLKTRAIGTVIGAATLGTLGAIPGAAGGAIGSQLGYRNKLARKARADKGIVRGKYTK